MIFALMLVLAKSIKLKVHLKKYELNNVTLFRNKTKRSFANSTKLGLIAKDCFGYKQFKSNPKDRQHCARKISK
jgi:hypothetical protein